MKQEQPIVKTEDYLFGTWVKGTEIIRTEKGEITILELLNDFRNHLLQNLEHNKEAYHQEQCAIHGVSSSYSKNDLCVAFEQARCNKHSFEDWYKFNYC